MPAPDATRGLFSRLNAGIFHLPTDDLVEIDAWLDTSRCITAVALIVISVALHQTIVPDLPLVRIPHPLGGIGLEQVRGRVEAALPAFLELVREHAK